MWCDQCRTDSAADVSAETGKVNCAACGADLGVVRRPATDRARELLQRWSTESPTHEDEHRAVDPPRESPRAEASLHASSRVSDSQAPRNATPTTADNQDAPPKSDGRLFLMPGPTAPMAEKAVEKIADTGLPNSPAPVQSAIMPDSTEARSARPSFVSRLSDPLGSEPKNFGKDALNQRTPDSSPMERKVPDPTSSGAKLSESRTTPQWAERPPQSFTASVEGKAILPMRDEYADATMDRADTVKTGASSKSSASGVNLQSRWPKPQERRCGSAGQILGQVLAYAGVLGITAGLAFVIWGYFGEQSHQMSTGWLIAAGGQMVLMLGFVTIVTEGLEQSRRDSLATLKSLEQRLERIEKNIARTALETRTQARTHSSDRMANDFVVAS